jgi:hypothetical protein
MQRCVWAVCEHHLGVRPAGILSVAGGGGGLVLAPQPSLLPPDLSPCDCGWHSGAPAEQLTRHARELKLPYG